MDTARKTIHHGGTEGRRNPFVFEVPSPRTRLFQVVLILAACLSLPGVRDGWSIQKQDHASTDQVKVAVVPITQEEHHHLVLENEYVRVFHVEVAPHSETKYHQHDMDYVFVAMGDSEVESVRVGEKPVKLELKDGDTRFTKGGFAHKAVNLSDKPFVNVTVELKKNSEPLQDCEPCRLLTTTTNKSKGKVARSSLMFSKDVYVSTWDLTGHFTQPIAVKMPDFLLVPLSDFQSLGASRSTLQTYRVGEAVWNKAGVYYWNPKVAASFVAIEFGQVP